MINRVLHGTKSQCVFSQKGLPTHPQYLHLYVFGFLWWQYWEQPYLLPLEPFEGIAEHDMLLPVHT